MATFGLVVIAFVLVALFFALMSQSSKSAAEPPPRRVPRGKTVGFYKGKHFTEYVEEFKSLKRAGKLDEAEELLLHLVQATEEESAHDKMGVAPAYYEHLAIIYKKRKEPEKELAILDRFAAQKHALGASPPKLLERREKLRKKLYSE